MKKIALIFAVLVSTSLYCNNPPSSIVTTVSICPLKIEDSASSGLCSSLFIGGVSLWALREILMNMGDRYAMSKAVAISYAKYLKHQYGDTLNEKEISFWSFVEGISSVPRIWWREILASALLYTFVKITYKVVHNEQKN